MEQYFYVIYLISFAIIFGIAYYLLKNYNQERELYQLFSKDDSMRAVMANDPKRFHISIVYLMTYMTRSDGDKVQRDKLEMIVRYIREVIPQAYHKEAIEALKYLTDREKGSGKHRKTESLVDVDDFMLGRNCLNNGDNSFHYIHDLHGKRLAEELAKYMTEDDRLYVMYLLYLLAAADKLITTNGNKSEKYMLERICVKGMKIDKNELDSLIHHFATGTDQIWYDQHFMNKEIFYPASNVLADIFRMDMSSLSLLDKQVTKVSMLGSTQVALFFAGGLMGVLLWIFLRFESDLMCDLYPSWLFIFGIIFVILLFIITLYSITELESSLVPILRTKIENSLQNRGLIMTSILSLIVVFSLLWEVSNTLFLYGNEMFSNGKSIVVTVPVTDTYITTTRSKNHTTTHYHVRFTPVSFRGKKIETEGKKNVSFLNSFCLHTLPWLSGMKLKGVENSKTMTSLEVGRSTYYSADGKDIQLYYKVGYFGLLYYDSYSLVDRKEDVATESFSTAVPVDDLETVENLE